jgi:hypothetical protein
MAVNTARLNWHDLGVNLAAPLEQAEDGRFKKTTAVAGRRYNLGRVLQGSQQVN